MLEWAIQAGIPVITTETNDLLNLDSVIKRISHPRPVKRYLSQDKMLTDGTVYCAPPGRHPEIVDATLYMKFSEHDCVLVIVNAAENIAVAFDAGQVPVPKEMLEEALAEVVGEAEVPAFIRCVTGLSLKQVLETVKISQVRDGPLTQRSLMATRSLLTGKLQGMQQVHIGNELYLPPAELEEWVDLNAPYFLQPGDPRLVPRGIIFHGMPGTGKTMASKYIARRWGVPLYRLEIAGALGRYVGESENRVSRVLSAVDQEEPCILLMDEVEKLFQAKDDSGVTSRILSQILWWLAEHESRVLCAMTSNNIDILPPELYRAGRIDRALEIERLRITEANKLGQQVLLQFIAKPSPEQVKLVRQAISAGMDGRDKKIAHAQVTAAVLDLIKVNQWKGVPQ